MPTELSNNPYPGGPPSFGPFASAVFGVFICLVLMICVWSGMPIDVRTVLGIMIPAMFTTTMLLFASMGWCFLLVGRFKRQPKWLIGTGIAIAIAMLQLLALTYMAGETR
jgi:hypothetical protein